MSKFKKGDKVRVVAERPKGTLNNLFVSGMDSYLGKELTVKEYSTDSEHLFTEENGWCWHETWLEPISENDLEIKDIIQRLNRANKIQFAVFATNMKMTARTTASRDIEIFAEASAIKCKVGHFYNAYPVIIKVVKANPSLEQSIISYGLNLLKNQ